jgi:flagellar hook-associated protein 1 FlgK
MSSFSIGISGLQAAQASLELIGTNVANASTPGYHLQEGVLTSVATSTQGTSVGGGVLMSGVTRVINHLLEQQLLQQQSSSSDVTQTLTVLQSLQSAFGQTGSEPLCTDLNAFFSSFSKLTTSPSDSALQEQVVNSGASLAGDFQQMSQYIQSTQVDLKQQVQDLTGQVNVLSQQVASLNVQIKDANNPTACNLLEDQRDQAVSDLSQLIGVQSPDYNDSNGMRNVSAGQATLVAGTTSNNLVSGSCQNGQTGLSVQGQNFYSSDYTGGQIGAVLELINHTLPALQNQLDTLAGQVIQGVNQLHVQGVGQGGSFDQLTSSQQGDGPISSWSGNVVQGSFYVRVINQSTGQVTRSQISVDPSTDTLDSVAQKLGQVANLSASVVGGSLTIQAASGYKFDFLPALSPTPQSSNITGTANVTISGDYTGTANAAYNVTVVGSGQVGVSNDLNLEVRDGSGALIETLNVGNGYAAGDTLDAGNGITLAMGSGTLNSGDTFQVQALASSDSSGFLAAAGLNTFFAGNSAGTIAVQQGLMDNPGDLAVSTSQSMNDVDNLNRMAALINQPLQGLGQVSSSAYLNNMISGVGTQVSTTQAQQTTLNTVVQQLTNQQDSISGVDINNESAQLLQFQQMYQSVAKYISTEETAVQYLLTWLPV